MERTNSGLLTWVRTRIRPWHRLYVALKIASVILGIFASITGIVYVAVKYSEIPMARLSGTYDNVVKKQKLLLDDMIDLQTDLISKAPINLSFDLKDLRDKAENTLVALAGLEVPTNRIQEARRKYRGSLEEFIGTVNRLERGGGSAILLHNSMQSVSNSAGDLRIAIEDFNGGLWSRARGALF